MDPVDRNYLMEMFEDLERHYDQESESVPPYEEYSRQMWQRANGIRDCIIDLYNAPTVKAIPIEWIKRYYGSLKIAQMIIEHWEAESKEERDVEDQTD